MKAMVIIALLLLGFTVGSSLMKYAAEKKFEMDFKELTNIDWVSFKAARADCMNKTKEPCRIYGGFAPKSAFAD